MDAQTQTPTLAIVLGALLGVVGVVAYILTGFASITALIPTIFGLILVGLGVWGRNPESERTATYAIGVFGILGILGSLRAVPDKIALLSGEAVDSVVATASQAILILVSVILLASAAYAILASR